MTDIDDAITWFGAQLDDEERVARAVGYHGHWRYIAELQAEELAHITRWKPPRVLALTAALRTLLDEFHYEAREAVAIMTIGEALFADRPGYRQEWKP